MAQDGSNFKRGYDDPWPPVRGDYLVGDPNAGVAVATLASPLFVLVGSHLPPYIGAAIYGPCKTENLGVEKIVANVISNCNIRFLIITGVESKGHLPGDTLLALHRNGIDEQGRIIGSKGAEPYPEEPFLVVKRKAALQEILMGEGDLFFGANVFMDTRAWQIAITV